MSTLTVADNKGGKKPQYKDYVSFLGNYKAGKKDDQYSVVTNDSGVNFSLNSSSNNSSSSINSDLTDAPTCGFKEYLEQQYNNKRYSSVQPNFVKKQNTKPAEAEEGKMEKTEVYIEIKNPSALTQVSKVVEINNTQNVCNNTSSNVSRVSKIFEKNSAASDHAPHTKPVHVNGKANTFKFEQKGTMWQSTLKKVQKKTYIGEISKKFQEKSPPPPETHKVQLRRSPSIRKKSKFFEDNDMGVETQVKKNSINEVSKVVLQTEESTAPKINGTILPKLPINNKPSLVVKPSINGKVVVDIPSPPPPPPVQCTENTSRTLKQPQVPSQNTPSCPPPPPPPPLQSSQSCIPPPPPPPPANLPLKKTQQSPPKAVNTNQKINGVVTTRPTENGRKTDVVDGIPVPVVDKNDPRVKRMVYGALREMYGAYHDKANDYIATLPRNRVKKNNGLDSIISSIASQGGLERLNGRVNPTVENE